MRFIIVLLASALFRGGPVTAHDGSQAPPGLVTYQLVILKTGPRVEIAGTPEGREILKQHVAHIYRLGAEGKSPVAGPLLDKGDMRGLLILRTDSPEQAHAIQAEDPAVKAGIFTIEVAPFMAADSGFGTWAAMGEFETVYFGFLNSGPNRGQDPETTARLQKEHLAYMDGQHQQGKLVMAGPSTTDSARRGIVVYRVGSAEEARTRAEGDPMVKVGRLAVELHPWQVPRGAFAPSR